MRTMMTAFVCAAVLLAGSARAETPEEDRLVNATAVLEQLAGIPESGIPPSLLGSAYGVAVLPNVLKAGFLVGIRRGKGVLVVRQPDGQWSHPSFIAVTGGSFGWQIGAQSSDIVLVFKNRRGVEGITSGKMTLGADASVAAGPVGRYTAASTDARFKAEVFSYSRSRGLFAGVALKGAALTIDHKANAAFYARPGISAADILDTNGVTAAVEARRFVATLSRFTPTLAPEDPPAAAAAPPEPAVRTYGIGEDAADEVPAPPQPPEEETFEPVDAEDAAQPR